MGQIMATWDNAGVTFTDNSTPDLNLFSDKDICIFGNTIASEKTKEATAAAALLPSAIAQTIRD